MSLEFCEVERHYDLLIEEGDDPTKDGAELREYMDKWDGLPFIDEVLINHDKDVLEIGVGTGRLALRVAPFCKRFVGIDLSKKTANRAKENLQEYKNASIVCGDFLGFPFHSLFDVVYSSLTFMHIEEKFRAIEKVAGLLRKGGRFVLSIDKSQNNHLDCGDRIIRLYPDTPKQVKNLVTSTNLRLIKTIEREFAYILVSEK